MEKIVKDKWVGFFVAPVIAILSIIVAIMYATTIHGHSLLNAGEFYKSGVFLSLLLGGIFAILLLTASVLLGIFFNTDSELEKVLKKLPAQIAPWLLLVLCLIGLGIFAPNALNIIMRVSMGLTPMEAVNVSQLMPSTVLLIITIILAVINVFLPVYRKENMSAKKIRVEDKENKI